MPVRDTSLKAFREHVASGNYKNQQEAVLDCIRRFGKATRRQLSARTRIEYGSVCSAVNKLVKQGALVETEKAQNVTKKDAWLLDLAPSTPTQLSL